MSFRRPIGVVGLITPFNFPMAIPTWKMFPALLCGNSVIIKPSEDVPHTVHLLVEILLEAGLPPDAVQLVHGRGETVGKALVEHPEVPVISFTGSTATGAIIGETCGRMHKRLSLEMGGKNAMIVMDDADGPAEAHGPLGAELRRHGMTEQAAAFGGGVVGGVDSFLHVAPGFRQHLAHFAGHRVRDGLLALDQQVAHPAQHVPPNRRRRAGPDREAALGGPDGRLEITRVGVGEASDQIVGIGRVAVVEVGAVARRHPLTTDVVAERLGHRS
jgi:hypothetical protein